MDNRVVRFINYLRIHGCVPTVELADQFGVSARTIRSYVCRANACMGETAHIATERGRGRELIINDQKAFFQLIPTQDTCWERLTPQTSDERVLYLLNDLLNRKEWITLDELANILFISRRTISGDLKQVEEVLKEFHLSLVRRPHYGIHVEGNEIDRRLCLASLVVGREGGYPYIGTTDDNHMVMDVSACVTKVVEEEKYPLSTVALQNLVVHVVIAIKRIHQGCYVPMGLGSVESIWTTREYSVAEHLVGSISQEFNVDFPQQEVAYIVIHLASKEMLDKATTSGNLVISDNVWQTVAEILEVVWEEFRFDFRNDLELRMNLARHLVPLSVRLRYRMPVKNPLLVNIKRTMPFAYLMASDSSSVLAERYGSSLSEDETGYIALIFALALERQRTELPKKNVLIVCSSGVGTARFLAVRVREEFGPYVGSVDTCDVTSLSEVDFSGIDYVFSTVPIEMTLPVPVCYAGLLLEGINMNNVRSALRDQEGSCGIESCFFGDLFFPHLAFMTKNETLTFLCQALELHEGLTHHFSELVDEREALARTAFGNGVALPHPAHPISKRTVVAVGLLDQPVDWDGLPVRAVFLFSITTNGDKEIRRFGHSEVAADPRTRNLIL